MGKRGFLGFRVLGLRVFCVFFLRFLRVLKGGPVILGKKNGLFSCL